MPINVLSHDTFEAAALKTNETLTALRLRDNELQEEEEEALTKAAAEGSQALVTLVL